MFKRKSEHRRALSKAERRAAVLSTTDLDFFAKSALTGIAAHMQNNRMDDALRDAKSLVAIIQELKSRASHIAP
jgi:hypothetical protein